MKNHKIFKVAIVIAVVAAIIAFLYELLSAEEYRLAEYYDNDDFDDDYFDCDDLFEE